MALAQTRTALLNRYITVTMDGAGPDVLLIPGLASSSDVWTKLAGELKTTKRLHRVQVAGFAGTPPVSDTVGPVVEPVAEAVAQYIVEQKLQAPAVIGHSMGGAVALILAARYPQLVERVMAVDAWPFYSLIFNPQATATNMQPHAQAFRDGLLAAPQIEYESMQADAFDRLVADSSERPALVASALSSDRTTVANATYDLMTLDIRPELPSINVPVEVLYAYHSRYGLPTSNVDQAIRSAYAALTAATFMRIDDSMHFVMLDQPLRFAEEVQRFLSRAR